MAAERVTPDARPADAHRAPLLLTMLLAAANFMQVLDLTIANVSLPAITGDLGAATSQGAWVITSYAVANAITVPLTGWLSDRYGQARLFATATALFTLATFLCGMSWTLPMLIAARVLQGAMAGFMVPLSQALLLGNYPPEKRGMALSIWGMTTTVAPIVGPLLGGWITDNISWPWIFYINVPVGLVAAAATWAIYKKRESPTRKLPIDGIGLALLVIWVGALQIMLDKGKELDWFHSPEVVTLGVVALVGFCFFMVWELTEEHPVVDLRLFTRRNFWSGTLAISVGYGLFFGNVVLLPLWLQQFMGYPSIDAGMLLAPVGLFAIILSPIVGKNISRVDPRKLASIAFIVFAIVLWMRSNFNTQADFDTILIPTLIQGIGMSLFFIPLSVILLSGIAPHKIPAASGLSSFVRIVAGSFGTSIATTIWQDRAAMHHAQLAESINAGNQTANQVLSGMVGAGFTPEQALAQVNRLVDQQAYMLGVNDVFYASALIYLLLIPVVWLSRPKRAGAGGADAAGGAH